MSQFQTDVQVFAQRTFEKDFFYFPFKYLIMDNDPRITKGLKKSSDKSLQFTKKVRRNIKINTANQKIQRTHTTMSEHYRIYK